MALEKGIDQLVQEFIAAGKPSSRSQSIDDRRAGYVASTVLAGESETHVQATTQELDATAWFESYTRNGSDYVITRDTLLSGYDMYLPHTERQHPEASPLWRDDFNGLPQTHVITAEFDPLCDEGEALHHHLTGQGVNCTCQRWSGVIHGFFQLGGISQAARDVIRDIAWRVGAVSATSESPQGE